MGYGCYCGKSIFRDRYSPHRPWVMSGKCLGIADIRRFPRLLIDQSHGAILAGDQRKAMEAWRGLALPIVALWVELWHVYVPAYVLSSPPSLVYTAPFNTRSRLSGILTRTRVHVYTIYTRRRYGELSIPCYSVGGSLRPPIWSFLTWFP